nr:unnamed protein product [Digitaria exilis]
MPGNPYDGEQPDPYDDSAKQYSEELGNQYDEQPGAQYDDGSWNLYNEEQATLYGEETGNQYNEEPANSYQEELENAYGGDVSQQDNSQVNVEDNRWPGWPGESVFRILVPAQKVGAIIGRKGEFIKKMCEESKARIKILDGPPGVPERAVMISAKDEPDALVSPAMDGLLRVHKRITDNSDGESGQPQRSAENVPPVALNDDRVVEIQGEPLGVHKAVELIATHLRKFLVDRTVLPLFEAHVSCLYWYLAFLSATSFLYVVCDECKFQSPQTKMHSMQREQPMPPPQHWGPPQPWGPPPNLPPGGPGFGGNPQFMPPRPQDNYYPPPDVPPVPVEKQPHYGISAYGREAPPSGVSVAGNQPPSLGGSQLLIFMYFWKVTHNMHIPLAYADAVIGSAGASISYIRRHSGATVTIQESRAAPGEMTVEIIGTASQVQTAQQLVQNFMAEAAPPGPPPASNPPAPPVDPSYGSYPPPYGAAPSYGSSAAAGPPPQYNGGSYGGPTYPPSYGY